MGAGWHEGRELLFFFIIPVELFGFTWCSVLSEVFSFSSLRYCYCSQRWECASPSYLRKRHNETRMLVYSSICINSLWSWTGLVSSADLPEDHDCEERWKSTPFHYSHRIYQSHSISLDPILSLVLMYLSLRCSHGWIFFLFVSCLAFLVFDIQRFSQPP